MTALRALVADLDRRRRLRSLDAQLRGRRRRDLEYSPELRALARAVSQASDMK